MKMDILRPSQSDCVRTIISVLKLLNKRAPFRHVTAVGGAYFRTWWVSTGRVKDQ